MALAWASAARAGDIEELSLEALLDAPVTTTSGSAIPAREAPGLIVRIERAEILRSGARDLADVLRFVPSLAPGLDVTAVQSLSIRGLWAAEGKVLILVDGTPLTDRMYGGTPLGDRIPAEIIDHVDVLRGPGGVVHGRYAQLAVIDVVTIGAGEAGSTYASARTSVGSVGIDDVGIVAGGVIPTKNGSIGTSVWFGYTHPFDGAYTDADGAVSDVGHERNERARASVMVTEGRWHMNVSAERYTLLQDTDYGYTWSAVVPMEFDQVTVDVLAHLPSGKVTVSPRLTAYWQSPWRQDSVPYGDPYYSRADVLYGGPRVDVLVPLSKDVEWTIGAEGSVIEGISVPSHGADYTAFSNDEPFITYATAGAFTQVVGRWPVATVAGGVRVDAQSSSGLAVVPRLAITRTFGETAHVKALVARAFRPPDVMNFEDATSDLAAELSTTAEIEVGVRPFRNAYLTASAFDQRIDHPITYDVAFTSGGAATEGYANGAPTSTYGADASLRWQPSFLAWTTALSWYAIPGEPVATANLAAPNLRAFSSAAFSPTDHLWITPSALITSATPAVTGFREDETSIVENEPAGVRLDLSARIDDLNDTGLCFDVGVQDLLNTRPPLIQAYDGGHLPIPTAGRSVFVRVGVGVAP